MQLSHRMAALEVTYGSLLGSRQLEKGGSGCNDDAH